jgi:hypothetical protein
MRGNPSTSSGLIGMQGVGAKACRCSQVSHGRHARPRCRESSRQHVVVQRPVVHERRARVKNERCNHQPLPTSASSRDGRASGGHGTRGQGCWGRRALVLPSVPTHMAIKAVMEDH